MGRGEGGQYTTVYKTSHAKVQEKGLEGMQRGGSVFYRRRYVGTYVRTCMHDTEIVSLYKPSTHQWQIVHTNCLQFYCSPLLERKPILSHVVRNNSLHVHTYVCNVNVTLLMQSTIIIQHTTYIIQHTTYIIQHTTYIIQHTTYTHGTHLY